MHLFGRLTGERERYQTTRPIKMVLCIGSNIIIRKNQFQPSFGPDYFDLYKMIEINYLTAISLSTVNEIILVNHH